MDELLDYFNLTEKIVHRKNIYVIQGTLCCFFIFKLNSERLIASKFSRHSSLKNSVWISVSLSFFFQRSYHLMVLNNFLFSKYFVSDVK